MSEATEALQKFITEHGINLAPEWQPAPSYPEPEYYETSLEKIKRLTESALAGTTGAIEQLEATTAHMEEAMRKAEMERQLGEMKLKLHQAITQLMLSLGGMGWIIALVAIAILIILWKI